MPGESINPVAYDLSHSLCRAAEMENREEKWREKSVNLNPMVGCCFRSVSFSPSLFLYPSLSGRSLTNPLTSVSTSCFAGFAILWGSFSQKLFPTGNRHRTDTAAATRL